MPAMPSLVRGFSGGKPRRSKSPRRTESLEIKGSNHSGSKLPLPSMIRSLSGGSVPSLVRNISGSSYKNKRSPKRDGSKVRRSGSGDSTDKRKVKKIQGFDDAVSKCMKESITHSPILSQPKEPYVTYFTADQVVRGGKFQAGEFFEFINVKSLPIQTNSLLDDSDPSNEDLSDSGSDDFLSKQYIIKQLSQRHVREKVIMEQATLRLVLEAKFLSRLNHPNLVQLRGMSKGEEQPLMNGGVSAFFTVLEKCSETLEDRIERWKKENRGTERFDLNSPGAQQKIRYAVDLAKALSYLHEKNIVVLNLRPENIGFLEDDTIQIRDLSCCRETSTDTLPSRCLAEGLELDLNTDPLGFTCDLQIGGDNASQMVAAKSNFLVLEASVEDQPRPRFVAPEAILEHKYTPAADTYSWAHILFHMLSLSKPYATYKLGMLLTRVCMEGSRPNLSAFGFPDGLDHLLQISWSRNHAKRPPMKALLKAIPLLLKMSARGGTTPQA